MYLTVPESLSGQVVMILVNLTGTVQFFFLLYKLSLHLVEENKEL